MLIEMEEGPWLEVRGWLVHTCRVRVVLVWRLEGRKMERESL